MLALLAAGAVAVPASARADTVRDAQMWVLDAVSAPSAWPVTRGQGATVAVIDSGVNPDVSDLAGSVITGPDLTGVHTPPGNPNWGVHGTWMASLIAGHGHAGGGSGIMGVAPAVQGAFDPGGDRPARPRLLRLRARVGRPGPERAGPGHHVRDQAPGRA